MSSTGQALGMVVGGVIGFFAGGNVALGASIGGAIGGYIDPPKGPNVTGPRLADLKQQTSSYGVPIPRVYGKDGVFGNVFWIENNAIKEVATKKKTGGKGGVSKGSITEYTYYGTFALGICLGPVAAIKRIWFNGKLFYVASSSDISTIVGSTQNEQYFTAYLGTDDQQPDPRMQATLGVGGTPAYRGLCYLVFKDLPLADHGNSIVGTQVKVDVVKNNTVSQNILYTTGNTTNTGFKGQTLPHIVSVDDGLLTVNQDYTGNYSRYLLSNFSKVDEYHGDIIYPSKVLNIGNPDDWINIGLFKGRKYYAQTVKQDATFSDALLGYGELYNAGSGTTGDLFRILFTGIRIDAEIISNRVSNGYSAAWGPRHVIEDVRGLGFFVMDEINRWYFIDFDGVLFSSGNYSIHSSGIYPSAFDSNLMRLVGVGHTTTNGGRVVSYRIDASNNMVFEYYVNNLSWPGNTDLIGSRPVYLIGGLVITQGEDYAVGVVDLDHETDIQANVRDIVSAECALSRVLDPSDIDVTELDRAITGYAVASVGAIRAPIEQLQAFYPFDAIPDGYKIKFKPRGGSSVATYDYSDLIYDSGQPILTRTRETDSQLPVRVSVKYTDAAREYDVSEQYAERYDGDLSNLRALDLPIVMGSDEAAGVAQALLYLYWLERYELSFVFPPSARRHQPADIITLTTNDETLVVRLVTTEDFPDGRISCTARLAGQTLYTPAAVGESAPPPSSILVPSGPTMAALLDLPYLMAGMNEPGFVGAMYSPLPSWSGGVFYNSNDGGESWDAIRPVTDNATVGTATTILAAPASYLSVDAASSVTVRLNHGTLASVTLLAMFNGANHFALGVNGRWEICAAQTVVANSDGTYTLSNLMRGRYGTEQYGGTHAVGDVFVLLDQAVLQFITVPVGNIGLQKLWRAVGRDKTLDSAPDIAFTYAAENLECRAPIRPRGNRNPATLDWTIECERRSRMPVEPFSGVATPIGETAEAYEVEIWDSTFSTLKRTITGLTAKSATWAQAQQVADFGVVQPDVYFRWYELSSIAGRGYKLEGHLYQSLGADPYIDSVVLGIHFDGAAFTDVRGATVSAFGNAQISTDQSKFGGSSGYFDGTGDYLTLPDNPLYAFGVADFTVEAYVYLTSYASLPCLIDTRNTPSGAGMGFFVNTSGNLQTYSGVFQTASTLTVPLNTWVHIEFGRSSGVLRYFIGGLAAGTATASGNLTGTSCTIGSVIDYRNTASSYHWAGYIDDLRVTNGVCRHTSTFTPPVEAFPNP